ncbi:S-adenosylmethionine:tRNA ribosyltransferase-isomerase [Formosimonas limnophila]|uniref:S-adenosylmethionine:tRNA ribosyltransferase-isomerase n=1 Tax=Formosimonas limnophila TaxID=1384487 RepID=A0A8J3FZJ3_9BURK|nr:tRNA preQ1(34) S-adenosylmethionine ribosyltransferase-isomerase QueA [Formosimonas limnophila]GHA63754.1 S-adenosylmethionine:tRNA ribosyltransferase-isomerase [Formosimonas limnophila]
MHDYFKSALPEQLSELNLTHFDYNLPDELIAQTPAASRTASRLLLPCETPIGDAIFHQIIDQLHSGDILVMNNTKVIKARLFGAKASGGKLEVMLDRLSGECECITQIRASKTPPAGSTIHIHNSAGEPVFSMTVLSKTDRFYHLKSDVPLLPMLEAYGNLPLPPYIDHAADDFDATRYQTVFAQAEGAVAAPTAGLHFDEPLLNAIQAKGVKLAYVTLHVGAGTFLPVSATDLSQHVMHQEWFEIGETTTQLINQTREAKGRVIAVGTTSLRALESAYAQQNPEHAPNWKLNATSAETRLFIRPPYRFGLVDALITNFHLPQSTLLMLVSAFSGVQTIRDSYNHAIEHRYRFFSYGDAMFLKRKNKHKQR